MAGAERGESPLELVTHPAAVVVTWWGGWAGQAAQACRMKGYRPDGAEAAEVEAGDEAEAAEDEAAVV